MPPCRSNRLGPRFRGDDASTPREARKDQLAEAWRAKQSFFSTIDIGRFPLHLCYHRPSSGCPSILASYKLQHVHSHLPGFPHLPNSPPTPLSSPLGLLRLLPAPSFPHSHSFPLHPSHTLTPSRSILPASASASRLTSYPTSLPPHAQDTPGSPGKSRPSSRRNRACWRSGWCGR